MVSFVDCIGGFLPQLWEQKTFKQIKKAANISSNNGLQRTLQLLQDKELLSRKKIGSTFVYSLQPRPEIFPLVELAARSYIKEKVVLDDIDIINNLLQKTIPFFSTILFGSYARREATASSDIDLLIIAPKKLVREELLRKKIALHTINKVDVHVVTVQECKKMLLAPYDNLLKQVLLANLPMKCAASFYALISN